MVLFRNVLLGSNLSAEQFWGRAVRRASDDSIEPRALSFAGARLARPPHYLLVLCFDGSIFWSGGSMAAWPINPFLAKASDESPLELGLPHCSEPDCEYCKELGETEDNTAKGNAAKCRVER